MVRRFGRSSMDWKARAGYGQKEILVYLAELSGQIYPIAFLAFEKWI